MRQNYAGMGSTGIGDNFAKARLLLAKRAGVLPQGQQIAQAPGDATEQWRVASRNLASNARRAGYGNAMMYLRTGAARGGSPPPPMNHGVPRVPPFSSLAYANSTRAMQRTAANPLPQMQQLPRMSPLPMMGMRRGPMGV